MGRTLPWRNACPQLVAQRLQQLANISSSSFSPSPTSSATIRLLLIHEKGPTSFVLKDANSSKKFTVSLGDVHSCTCVESRAEMCLHMLYVLQKVFRIPAVNPLLWQRSFLDAEIHDLVLARNRMRNLYRLQNLQQQQVESAGRNNVANEDDDDDDERGEGGSKNHSRKQEIPQKPLTPDDSCPICCEPFDLDLELGHNNHRLQQSSSEKLLVWCRFGCGNSIHVRCFRDYCQFHATRPEPLCCPLCRTKWGQLDGGDFGGDLPRHPAGTKCDACRSEVVYGERFRCCYCPRFDLCPTCYNTRPNTHAQHPFDFQHGPGAKFVPAPPRPLPPPSNSAATFTTSTSNNNNNNNNVNGNNNNNRNSLLLFDSPQRQAARCLTLNESLRFAVPCAEALRQHMTKYFGRFSSEEGMDGEKELFERNLTCPICVENFFVEKNDGVDDNNESAMPEKLIFLPSCGHLFHVTCGTQWLTHGGANCPFCRFPVSTAVFQQQQQQQQPTTSTSTSTPRMRQHGEAATTSTSDGEFLVVNNYNNTNVSSNSNSSSNYSSYHATPHHLRLLARHHPPQVNNNNLIVVRRGRPPQPTMAVSSGGNGIAASVSSTPLLSGGLSVVGSNPVRSMITTSDSNQSQNQSLTKVAAGRNGGDGGNRSTTTILSRRRSAGATVSNNNNNDTSSPSLLLDLLTIAPSTPATSSQLQQPQHQQQQPARRTSTTTTTTTTTTSTRRPPRTISLAAQRKNASSGSPSSLTPTSLEVNEKSGFTFYPTTNAIQN